MTPSTLFLLGVVHAKRMDATSANAAFQRCVKQDKDLQDQVMINAISEGYTWYTPQKISELKKQIH